MFGAESVPGHRQPVGLVEAGGSTSELPSRAATEASARDLAAASVRKSRPKMGASLSLYPDLRSDKSRLLCSISDTEQQWPV